MPGGQVALKNEKLTKKVVLEQYRLFFDIFKGNLTLRHTVLPSDPMYRGFPPSDMAIIGVFSFVICHYMI